jgi:hypothetical protein
MIDATNETLLTLAEAARLPAFRRAGRPAHISTLWRWRSRGARAVDGSRVQLETLRVPGGIRTSTEAVDRFLQRLNADPGAEPVERSTRQRHKASEAANAELVATGW